MFLSQSGNKKNKYYINNQLIVLIQQTLFKVSEDVSQSVYWIKFKEPISTDQIKMDMFSGKNGVKDPDFTEIYLVK